MLDNTDDSGINYSSMAQPTEKDLAFDKVNLQQARGKNKSRYMQNQITNKKSIIFYYLFLHSALHPVYLRRGSVL
jgi:hypothetical protein